MPQSRISARYALTEKEFECVRMFAGFGFRSRPESWKRTFGERDPESGKVYSTKDIQKRADSFFVQSHIVAYIDELRGTSSDHARQVLEDQVLFGATEALRRQAAETVLSNQDKLGIQDAAEKFWEVTAAIGAEVVVPIPGRGEVVAPVSGMFPQFKDALPPPDVIVKTMKSLDQYLWVALGPNVPGARKRDPHNWTFLDGLREYEQKRAEEAAAPRA